DMCVYGDRRLAEGCVQDDISRFSAHAGQRFERLARPWRLSAVLLDELLAHRDDVARLGIEQADGADVLREAIDAEREDRLGRVGVGEQLAGGEIHALVGGLCRENDRDQQLERSAVFEFRGRLGIGGFEPLEDGVDLAWTHVLAEWARFSQLSAAISNASAMNAPGGSMPSRNPMSTANTFVSSACAQSPKAAPAPCRIEPRPTSSRAIPSSKSASA